MRRPRNAVRSAGGTFRSLAIRNYRLYFWGQSISLIGTWVQAGAQAWLVLALTNSSTKLGIVVALQTLPLLLLGPYSGVIADRGDRRRLMIILQSAMGCQAVILGTLTGAGVIRYWQICVLAVVLGVNSSLENPVRQAFIYDMVGSEDLPNAVRLNAVSVNAARALGPSAAGLLIAALGETICFFLNAVSFAAVVYSLIKIDRARLHLSPRVERGARQLRAGLGYAMQTPDIAIPLVMMAIAGALAYQYQVTLPVFARETLHGGPRSFGFLMGAMGSGAVVGGLVTAAYPRTGTWHAVIAVSAFGAGLILTGLSVGPIFASLALFATGWASVSFVTTGNSTIQLAAQPSMRGRVLALWQVAFLGTAPLGAPLVGWIMAAVDPRAGLFLGGASCLLAAAIGTTLGRRFAARSP